MPHISAIEAYLGGTFRTNKFLHIVINSLDVLLAASFRTESNQWIRFYLLGVFEALVLRQGFSVQELFEVFLLNFLAASVLKAADFIDLSCDYQVFEVLCTALFTEHMITS